MTSEFCVVPGDVVSETILGNLEQCLWVVERAYLAHDRGETVNPSSYFLRFPRHAARRIIALPGSIDAEFCVSGIKWIASYPQNIERGIPRASATVVLNDAETGRPFALLEGATISAARTAASAVLGARVLMGGRHVSCLGIVGTGLISRHVYDFLVGTGWDIDRVALYDVRAERAEGFAEHVRGDPRSSERSSGVPSIRSVESAEEAIAMADLVVVATTSATPHLLDPNLFAHAPVVLHLSLRDLAPAVIRSAANYTDDGDHVMNANTSLHLTEQDTGGRDFLNGTLADLLLSRTKRPEGQVAIFSPFGLGILDLAVGKWVYDEARRLGRETRIDDFFGHQEA